MQNFLKHLDFTRTSVQYTGIWALWGHLNSWVALLRLVGSMADYRVIQDQKYNGNPCWQDNDDLVWLFHNRLKTTREADLQPNLYVRTTWICECWSCWTAMSVIISAKVPLSFKSFFGRRLWIFGMNVTTTKTQEILCLLFSLDCRLTDFYKNKTFDRRARTTVTPEQNVVQMVHDQTKFSH